jgi:branched-chain amino acid transport system substrate-binding protein
MSTVYFVGCEKKSKKIAFVGALTGRTADVGTAARDGAILAMEEQNRKGGIDGQLIELIIGDDKNDPKEAVRVDESVIAQGVLGIVGHVTSVACLGGVEVANRAHVPLVSPTVSTNELSRKRDYFFRIYPASAQTASLLAQYVVDVRGFKRVAIVLDMGNRAHSESAALAFTARLHTLGGDVVQTEPFVSSRTMRFSAIADAIDKGKVDVLYVLANAMDTAMLAQQLKKQNKQIPMVASDWSMSNEVIQYGGRAVEGLTALHTLQFNSTTPKYRAFFDAFVKRFGREPTFAATHGYDAMRLLLRATSGSVTPEQVARKLSKQEPFDTLQDRIVFDEFGDVTRKHWLVRVVDGHLQEVDK